MKEKLYLVTNKNLQRFFDNPGLLMESDPTFQGYVSNAWQPRNAATQALNLPGFTYYAAVLSVHEVSPVLEQFRPTIKEWKE